MPEFHGSLRLPGDDGPPLDVVIDLTDSRLHMTAGDAEIGDWSMDEVRIAALPDGFHLRAEGEEAILEIREDAAFALALGLRTAPPLLRRKMAALMRND